MKQYIFLLLIFFFFQSGEAPAQVTISPTAVFLDPGSNVGSFYVSNPSETPVEVQLSFEFAYPQTDSLGNVTLNYIDEDSEDRYSLKPYIRAFPTTFMLDSGQRQTVRLIGQIPINKPDGVHWTRMRVSSSQLSPSVGETDDTLVSAQIAFQIDQVTAVFARKGATSTGLQINGTEILNSDDKITVLTNVNRTGNAPFIGSVQNVIRNEDGEIVEQRKSSTSVYFNNHHRAIFNTENWPAGEYLIETKFISERSDIPSRNLVQSIPVSEKTHFTIK
ncbi:hypothetical protein DYD21_19920 [Rhodohalobacter sp. SW132]|uniref:hypothetical protein n=1 Tax=Rhodohalobacter sp. SW132 TaxID=2293433 RepID=UPI000E26DB71|nr:hypothetical protein [Rhodohalobacter sp. SW132]REL24079.1 hypothetical protein DYD21_19920 [Rhodohalobacter sp. SW132]